MSQKRSGNRLCQCRIRNNTGFLTASARSLKKIFISAIAVKLSAHAYNSVVCARAGRKLRSRRGIITCSAVRRICRYKSADAHLLHIQILICGCIFPLGVLNKVCTHSLTDYINYIFRLVFTLRFAVLRACRSRYK